MSVASSPAATAMTIVLAGFVGSSTGLAPADRSEDWVAVAIGPEGETRSCRAAEPDDALRGLTTVFE